jgi:NDP-sugar pyrophosphorylase family protein
MKAVILAGGLGTRISEETHLKPKPMIEIGGKPILWHIMKIYSSHGVNEFIICCGYKGYIIKYSINKVSCCWCSNKSRINSFYIYITGSNIKFYLQYHRKKL